MRSISLMVVASALVCVLLLLVHAGDGAPAQQHLAISVEGNTPTLIVTSSAGTGVTPKTLPDTIATTTVTTTAAPTIGSSVLPSYEHKKTKSKLTKLQFQKKRQQSRTKGATKSWYQKAFAATPSPPAANTPPPSGETTTGTTLPSRPAVLKPAAASATEASDVHRQAAESATLQATDAAAASGIADKRAAAKTAAPSQQEVKAEVFDAITATTLGNLPQSQRKAPVTLAPSTTRDDDNSAQLPQSAGVGEGTAPDALKKDNVGEAGAIATATGTGTTISEAVPNEVSPTPTSTAPLAATTAETSKTSVITTAEARHAVPAAASATTVTTRNKSGYGSVANLATSSQPPFPPIAAASHGIEPRERVTSTAPPPPSRDDTHKAERHTQNRAAVLATKVYAATTSTSASITTDTLIDAPEDEQRGDGIVKLIDLENHDLKSIGAAKQQQPPLPDGGHDGIKVTRKKQLSDKHFLLDLVAATTMHPSSGKHTDRGEEPGEPTTSMPERMHSAAGNVEKTLAATPTLVPVHNGYLGPIIMEERTFSVIHNNRKAHESALESQLRSGHFVEIIAPTALVEQPTTAAATSTTAQPSRYNATTVFLPTIEQTADSVNHSPVLSTTVFQVAEQTPGSSTTRLPLIAMAVSQESSDQVARTSALAGRGDEPTESKISDIQIEVYDSTVDSIVASTNFKDNDGSYRPQQEPTGATTKPPAAPQERFTQYVVDRTDSSTPQSNIAPPSFAGKPEPAAIEIHINVSEGLGNESEDLEFSYRQPDFSGSAKPNMNSFSAKASKPISLKSFASSSSLSSGTSATARNETSDEILVVEIIDTGDNSTENSVSAENINPIFTFRSDTDTDIELKDIKYFPPEPAVKPPHMTDELFLADVKKTLSDLPQPPPPPPPPPRKPNIDRDSDTIFYISNTEVKVGESLPTVNTNYEQQLQLRKSRLESQFFPANYMASTHPNARIEELLAQHRQHRYEEDIILSPVRNTADSLKIFRTPVDSAPPLDVTYVGESVMEVEQSAAASIGLTTASAPNVVVVPQTPDVIIQPAILPEMSIGVPVIGELPPQIELKEIDFMPDEADQPRPGVYENNVEETVNVNSNDVDRLVESSIQYGGDLIDEGAGGGFDGIEGSYPFGNPVALRGKAKHDADFAHSMVHHGVSNLRKDELSVDVAGSAEAAAAAAATVGSAIENSTVPLGGRSNSSETSANITYATAERMGNATAFSVMDQSGSEDEAEFDVKDFLALMVQVGTIFAPTLVIILTACGIRFLYNKYRSKRVDSDDDSESNHGNGSAGGGGQKEESAQLAPPAAKYEADSEIKSKNDTNLPTTERPSKPSNSSSVSILDETCVAAQSTAFTQRLTPAPTPGATQSNLQSDQSNSVQANYAGPNGSITKMTLKNNHLIVETEERNDISRDARETKMHYNTSEKDGVFVVEVARGIDSKAVPDSPIADGDCKALPAFAAKSNGDIAPMTEDESVLKSHEEVQIHPPPLEIPTATTTTDELQRSLHQIEEVEEPALSPNCNIIRQEADAAHRANTGLSQSDLSSTSSTESNKRYSYGNQELYVIENAGYASISATTNLAAAPNSTGEGETQDDDHKSENGHSLEHSPATGAAVNDDSCALAKENDVQEVATEKTKCAANGYVVNIGDKGPSIEEDLVSGAIDETKQNDEKTAIDEERDAAETEHSDAPIEVLASINGTEEPSDAVEVTKNHVDGDTYDSIMSLPEPPSSEEIIQLNDYSLTDASQMDSLPPPPPPPPLLETPESGNGEHNAVQPEKTAQQLKASQLSETLVPTKSALLNGHGTEEMNGHESAILISALPPPPPAVTEVTNGEMLTPPASPPPSPPTHFGNAITNGIHAAPLPLAVDVNGS